jgi:hypothetical protein
MSYNGCCFFAYNNSEIDYVQLAMLAALYVKKHMKNNNTCLITSEGDYNWLESSLGKELVDKAFDEVVITDVKQQENVEHIMIVHGLHLTVIFRIVISIWLMSTLRLIKHYY